MKRLLALCLLLFCFGCAKTVPVPVPPPIQKDFTITGTWKYDFTNFAACSATVTKGCISGFSWGYLQGATEVPLKSSATSACTGATQPEPCTDVVNSQLPMGSLTFYLLANFIDNSGNAGTTAAVDTANPTVITAGAATAFSVTAQ